MGFPAPGCAVIRESVRGSLRVLRRSLREETYVEGKGEGAEQALGAEQQAWWFLHQLAPQSPQLLHHALRIQGALDLPALERALQQLLSRHEPLRATFTESAGAAAVRVRPEARVELERLAPGTEPKAALAAWCARPLALDAGALVRVGVLARGAQDHLLLLSGHQAVCDARSLEAIWAELFALYQAERAGRAAGLPAPRSYFTEDQERRRRPAAAAAQDAEFWKRRLEGASGELALAGVEGAPGARVPAALSPELGLGLAALAGGDGAAGLLAAWLGLLARYTEQEELVVGVPFDARGEEAGALVGPRSLVLPLRLAAGTDQSFKDLVAAAVDGLREAASHVQAAPEPPAGARTDASAPSWLQVGFCVLPAPVLPRVEGLELRSELLRQDLPWARLALAGVLQADGGAALELAVGAGLLSPERAVRLPGHLMTFIGDALARPDDPIRTLALTGADEARALAAAAAVERQELPNRCIHELISDVAKARGAAIAVESPSRKLSYTELEQRAQALCRKLQARGVGRGKRVGVLVDPSAEMVVALLGVLKSGAAYVPLDPGWPAERLAFILQDARVELLLTEPQLAAQATATGRELLLLDPGPLGVAPAAPAATPAPATPDDLAYVIYTSGSTGEPKGVLIPHRALLNHGLAVSKRFGLRDSDRMLQFTPVYFDAAAEEIYPPLLMGGTVVVRSELAAADAFSTFVEEQKISVLSLPPAYLAEWIAHMRRASREVPACLRLTILGGEKLLPQNWQGWLQVGGARVPWFNVYGPSEATITASLCEISPTGFGLAAPVMPIGRAIPNVSLLLLDDRLRPVPAGLPGAIYLAGPGLAWGYVGRPEQTAERFLPHPYGRAGERMYATGDVGRLLPDGNVEFVGRVDQQVKIRGFRVELGEVESALRKVPGVDDAVVVVRAYNADRRLVGYVASKVEPPLAPAALRAALESRLPGYMVPSALVVLRALPLTANGKVDRKALPAPEAAPAPAAAADRELTPTEKALREIWMDVLGLDSLKLDDNFFELGGHSLTAIQVVARAGEVLGVDVTLAAIFDAPTLRALAAHVAGLGQQTQLPEGVTNVDQLSDEQVEAMLKQLQGG